ncbi:ethylene-responsive transcription factor [Canna indica]|uniref:Ethylene-responsive transcription factor n=1 Tax=Canna indica TaxID=4628 RepID=A0AAQ3QJM2_9LILI|nr:ethylene-responsive transcription factor [Canna indica]
MKGTQARTNFIYSDTPISTFHSLLNPFHSQNFIPQPMPPPPQPPSYPQLAPQRAPSDHHHHGFSMMTQGHRHSISAPSRRDAAAGGIDSFLFQSTEDAPPFASPAEMDVANDFLFSDDTRSSGYLSSVVPESCLKSSSSSSSSSSRAQALMGSGATSGGHASDGRGGALLSSEEELGGVAEMSKGFWMEEPVWELSACGFADANNDVFDLGYSLF